MVSINFLLRWGWLLGAALCCPVSLPAGGATLEKIKLCKTKSLESSFTGSKCQLRPFPLLTAPIVNEIEIGTPVTILRSWEAYDGRQWFHIELTSIDFFDSQLKVKRGWVNA